MPEITENKYREYIPNITKARITKIEDAKKLFYASSSKKIQYATREGFLVRLRMFLHKHLGIYNDYYTEVQKRHAKIATFFVEENISKNVSTIIDYITNYKSIDDARDTIISNVFAIQQILEPFNINFLLQADDNNNNIKINVVKEELISFDIPCPRALYEILKQVFDTNKHSKAADKYHYLIYYSDTKNQIDDTEKWINEKKSIPSEEVNNIQERRDIKRYMELFHLPSTANRKGSLLHEIALQSIKDIPRNGKNNTEDYDHFQMLQDKLKEAQCSTDQVKAIFLLYQQTIFNAQHGGILLSALLSANDSLDIHAKSIEDNYTIDTDGEKKIFTLIRFKKLVDENDAQNYVSLKYQVKAEIDKSGDILSVSPIDLIINDDKNLDKFSLEMRFWCYVMQTRAEYIKDLRKGKLPEYVHIINKELSNNSSE